MSLTEPVNNLQSPQDEITLRDIISTIKKGVKFIGLKLKIILLIAVLGGLSGYLYARLKKTTYSAVTTFVLEDSNQGGGIGGYAGIASALGADLSSNIGGIFEGDNILELYKSNNMLRKALLAKIKSGNTNQLFVDRYIAINKPDLQWQDRKLKAVKFSADSAGTLSRLQDSILKSLISVIKKNALFVTRPDKKLSIYKVEVVSPDEVFAKEFNDQIVQTVNSFYIQTKTKKSLQSFVILQHQVDSVKNVLNSSMTQAVSLNDATPNLNPTRQILRIGVQRSQVDVDASKAVLTQLIQNLELSKITLRKETPLIQVVDVPFYPLDKNTTSKTLTIIFGAFLFGFIATIAIVIKGYINHILA